MSHTPTPIEGPWKVNGTATSDGYRFWAQYKAADHGEFETGEEARKLARELNAIEAKRDIAVNAHDKLVAAVRAYLSAQGDCDCDTCCLARAALAAAEGKP